METSTWIVKYNGIVVPGEYLNKEEAIESIERTLGKVDFNEMNIAFWPAVGARGNIMIEVQEVK